jgi:hypothetical protein
MLQFKKNCEIVEFLSRYMPIINATNIAERNGCTMAIINRGLIIIDKTENVEWNVTVEYY